jgi:DNA replication and repair protein RecF
VLVIGPNGAGKTNLLESLHVGTQGFSPRTRNDAQLVRFGEAMGRVSLRGRRAETPLELDVTLEPGKGKRAKLNGGPLRAAELLRAEVSTLVFTPDRLGIVKGAPAVRRAYFDRALGRLFPARAGLSAEYGAVVGQRNAALRRVANGSSSHDAVEPWTEQVAALGTELAAARRHALELLTPAFTQLTGAFGLEPGRLAYEGGPVSREQLDERLARDLERGTTSLGPHLDDIAVLSLLLAEAEILLERGGVPPLLLLDDVLSELDPERRATLARLLPEGGQTLITSTTAGALPLAPDQLLEVAPGTVRAA